MIKNHSKTFSAQLSKLRQILNWTVTILNQWEIQPLYHNHITLFIEESITNIIRHGYVDANKDLNAYITLTISYISSSSIKISLEDAGKFFNPTKQIEDKTKIRCGLDLIHKLSKTIHYERKNEKNYFCSIIDLNIFE